MAMFKTRFTVSAPDGDEFVRWGELPFIPPLGMDIGCGDGDFREVKALYWHCNTGELEVWLGEAEETAKTLKALGWLPEGQAEAAKPQGLTKTRTVALAKGVRGITVHRMKG